MLFHGRRQALSLLQLKSLPYPSQFHRNLSALQGAVFAHPDRQRFLKPNHDLQGQRKRDMSLEETSIWFQTKYNAVLASEVVHKSSEQLCAIHDLTGLPWWATIAGVTLTLRGGCFFWAHVVSQKVKFRVFLSIS